MHMKKSGVLHAQLARVVASMGHQDRLVIGDSGLPVPHGGEVIDLALTPGIPRFTDVLRVVLEELKVEAFVVADEMADVSKPMLEAVRVMLPEAEERSVSHEQFKRMMRDDAVAACVRTGETTPYANVMLIAGVIF